MNKVLQAHIREKRITGDASHLMGVPDERRPGRNAMMPDVLHEHRAAKDIYYAGMDPRGYLFFGLRSEATGEIWVAAGCKMKEFDRAREHWGENSGHDHASAIQPLLEKIAFWADDPESALRVARNEAVNEIKEHEQAALLEQCRINTTQEVMRHVEAFFGPIATQVFVTWTRFNSENPGANDLQRRWTT